MQPANDLLQLIRLQVDIYHNAKVCGDWQIREHEEGQTCFHLVTLGDCVLELPDQPQQRLARGDLLVFPREIPHRMTPVEPLSGPQRHLPYAEAARLPGTGLLCATVHFRHRAAESLLDALPEMLLIRGVETRWLLPLTGMIEQQSVAPGPVSDAILERLCELLFAYSLDHHLASRPAPGGLLSLYGHQRIGRALHAMHQAPEREWTLEALAREAAQSRTSFAATFKALSGWTPARYLTWWRMQLAWEHLQSGLSVGETAEKTGYRSQAAFSRAFRKCFAVPASAVRRGLIPSAGVRAVA